MWDLSLVSTYYEVWEVNNSSSQNLMLLSESITLNGTYIYLLLESSTCNQWLVSMLTHTCTATYQCNCSGKRGGSEILSICKPLVYIPPQCFWKLQLTQKLMWSGHVTSRQSITYWIVSALLSVMFCSRCTGTWQLEIPSVLFKLLTEPLT